MSWTLKDLFKICSLKLQERYSGYCDDSNDGSVFLLTEALIQQSISNQQSSVAALYLRKVQICSDLDLNIAFFGYCEAPENREGLAVEAD